MVAQEDPKRTYSRGCNKSTGTYETVPSEKYLKINSQARP